MRSSRDCTEGIITGRIKRQRKNLQKTPRLRGRKRELLELKLRKVKEPLPLPRKSNPSPRKTPMIPTRKKR
jgi:hypothetical protein